MEVLAGIWCEVLGVEGVGVDDDFFELGGDSISAMQVVARARRAGLGLTARRVFEHSTVARLAAAAEPVAARRPGRPRGGRVPLTPIQRWFLAQEVADRDAWAHTLVLESSERLDAGLLERALTALVAHHAALRLRFTRGPRGWAQRIASARRERVQVARFGPETDPDHVAADLRGGLDLARGPVLRAGLVDRGAGRSGLLLVAVHHLVADAISLGILLDDLGTVYRQLARGGEVELPDEVTSFAEWSRGLRPSAAGADHWARFRPPEPSPTAETGGDEPGPLTVSLGRRPTARLRRLGARADEIALAALVLALGGGPLLVDVEGHGRADGDADLSRTVGFLTALYPVVLDAGPEREARRVLERVRAQLGGVPNGGVDYGILRFRRRSRRLASLPQAAVRLNHLGRLDGPPGRSRPFHLAGPPVAAPQRIGSYLLEIDLYELGGRLRAVWRHAPGGLRGATIERWAAAREAEGGTPWSRSSNGTTEGGRHVRR